MGLLFEEVVRIERAEFEDRYWVRATFLDGLGRLQLTLTVSPFFVGRSLAPGAQSLLKPLTDPSLPPHERVDIKKQIRGLDIKDWALILRAFNNWPFAPEVSKHSPPCFFAVAG